MTATVVALLWVAFLVAPVTVAEGEEDSPPSAPWGLVAAGDLEGNVTLLWQVPFDDGGSPILEYRVYRAPINESFALVGSSATTNFTDAVPASQVELFEYVVTAVNAVGESEASTGSYAASSSSCVDVSIGVIPGIWVDWDCLGVCDEPPVLCFLDPSICIPGCL